MARVLVFFDRRNGTVTVNTYSDEGELLETSSYGDVSHLVLEAPVSTSRGLEGRLEAYSAKGGVVAERRGSILYIRGARQ